MTSLTKIAQLITEARRRQGMTQSALAHQIGCKQSAISMFERGHENALAHSKVEAVAKLLGIDALTLPDNVTALPVNASSPPLRYCPVFDCPSNIPFTVQNKLLISPNPNLSSNSEKHCIFCGELLELACPECGETINSGACCALCGTPYISVPPDESNTAPIVAWVEAQQQRLRTLGILPG